MSGSTEHGDLEIQSHFDDYGLHYRKPASRPVFYVHRGAANRRACAPSLTDGAAERNFAFVRLANKYPDARLVYTGGASSMTYQQYKAADAAKRLYAELGLDIDRILFERESRNTAESAVNVKRLVNPKPGEKWMLLTTGWHMPRSVGVFCKVGWQVIPYPVDFQTKPGYLLRIGWGFTDRMRDLNTAVKEWIGLLSYSLLGRSC